MKSDSFRKDGGKTWTLRLFLLAGAALTLGVLRLWPAPEELPLREPVQWARAELRVLRDELLVVTEWISVSRSSGGEMRRGILRSLPKRVSGRERTYKPLSARIDGDAVPLPRPEDRGERIVYPIGSGREELSFGSHEFFFQYEVRGGVLLEGEVHELRFALLDAWPSPKLQSAIVVKLPEGVGEKELVHSAWIAWDDALGPGVVGDGPGVSSRIAKEESPVGEPGYTLLVHTTRPLAPDESLAILLRWR